MYACEKCDSQYLKWEGRCTQCGGWGTVKEEGAVPASPRDAGKKSAGKRAAAATSARLFDAAPKESVPRVPSGIGEVDRVLGGGIVPGSLVLLAGEPGIGKSTLVATIAGNVGDVLYVSGEESTPQLADRFRRLGVKDPSTSSGQAGKKSGVRVLDPFPVETIVATFEKEKPTLCVIDSVQTLTSSELDATAGSQSMVRYAAGYLLEACKRSHVPVLLIGQVTKDGSFAGPKTLEHLVDVALSLEGDPQHAYRLLRAAKNRFGSTDEVGVFEMTGEGLKPVENPSAKFLEERANVPGSVVTAAGEGSRVFLVEVQALVEKSGFGMPVRRASGFDGNRLQMLCAILSRRAGVKLGEKDVYVNVVGGLTLTEPAVDLAVCAAILSAESGEAFAEPRLFLGEVGLGGEVRSVPFLERRLLEAKRLGIANAVIPARNAPKVEGIAITPVKTVRDLLVQP